MKIAVLKESAEHERRVAATPETVKSIMASGLTVLVQSRAGEAAHFSDAVYEEAGAKIVSDLQILFREGDIFFKVQKPNAEELSLLQEGKIWISFLNPLNEPELIKNLAQKKIIALAIEMIPRIARAQKLDALSSQSNLAGYKAVLLAANKLGKIFPMMMTAAGTLQPAKVMIIGAGVAGLQAIATAHRLGAIVHAYDTRPSVKEQVQSLGGIFIDVPLSQKETETRGGYAKELSRQDQEKIKEILSHYIAQSDVMITTAAIPGKPSPKIITAEMVLAMKPGSVIVDLAAEGGGNCILTQPGKEIIENRVTIIGTLNIPSLLATQASQLYAKNLFHLLSEFVEKGKIKINLENEILKDTVITHAGEIINLMVKKSLGMP